jgi:hypothetical protein
MENWKRILLETRRPSDILREMDSSGRLAESSIELARLRNVLRDSTEAPLWEHTLRALDVAADIVRREKMSESSAYAVLLAVLTEDMDNAAVSLGASPRESRGNPAAAAFLKKAGVDQAVATKTLKILEERREPLHLYRHRNRLASAAVQNLAERIRPASLNELLAVSEADRQARGAAWHGFPVRGWLLSHPALQPGASPSGRSG